MTQYQGMAKEILDYREKTGEDALWTNSMFSGMPAYLINMKQPGNVLVYPHNILNAQSLRPACHAFLYMLGFYILLLLFGVQSWLSIAGALAYGFSSYLFIILVPGHITKAMALGYMPMVVGSIYYTYRKNILTGAALTSLFLGLQLLTNHLQITYYTLLIVLIFGIFELFRVFREKAWKYFLNATAALMVAAIIAVGVNITGIWTVYENSPFTLRGPSELTHDSEDQTSGLNKTYATQWSYGIEESINLLIPNLKGGASDILMADRDSKTFEFLSKTQGGAQNAIQIINSNAYFFTQYWGEQPGTSGPVYIGAVIVFLFVFGMFFTKGQLRWWLLTVVVFSIVLAWGRNFSGLTNFFLDHFPGYNKFRTVSMILVMAELAFPLLAIVAVGEVLKGEYERNRFMKSFRYALYSIGGICALFLLFPTLAGLDSPKDTILVEQGAGDLVAAIKEDRASLVRLDSLRSLIFVLLTAGLVYLAHLKKIKTGTTISILSLAILIDLWPVNKRYLNDDNFVPKRQLKTAFQPYQADLDIMKDPDPHYRVFDMTAGDPFASSRASYFHKSLGGYHGAKFRRYQELYDKHIKEGNESVLDMLNTKYLIIADRESGQAMAVPRTTKLGNAWMVKNYKLVENADEEIASLKDFNPAETMIIDKRFAEYVKEADYTPDSTDMISLTEYRPDRIYYSYSAKSDKLVAFSEIYYPKGWKLYVDDQEVPHFRANYVLRAAVLPAGEHEMRFEFRPNAYYTGNKIAMASSVLMVLFLAAVAVRAFYPLKKS